MGIFQREPVKTKKFLQACELGGSLYGKEGAVKGKAALRSRGGDSKTLFESYDSLFKKQSEAMAKVFGK